MKIISNYCMAAFIASSAIALCAPNVFADSSALSRMSPVDTSKSDIKNNSNQWVTLGNKNLASFNLPPQNDKIGMMKTCAQTRANTSEEVYFENFDDVDTFQDFTIIDANEDGTTWQCEEGDGFAYVRYNRTLQMDDWMITPAIELEAGVTYVLEFMCAATDRNVPETIEVFAGTGTTVADMSVPVVKPISVVSEIVKGVITPTESGKWYLGFHGISAPNMGMLFVLSITLTEGPSLDTPAIPSYLEIIPDYDGSLTSEVKVTVPDKTLADDNISSMTSLVITRDWQVVKTFDNPTPGETLSFFDTSFGDGYHLYSAYGVNEAGEGASIDKMGYTGTNKANAPLNPTAVEHGNTGLVTVTWDAPETNIDGYPMNPDLISYVVMGEDIAFVDERTIDIQVVPEGEQQRFEYFLIMSNTDAGVNTTYYAKTMPGAYGLPYSTPFKESFKDSDYSNGWICNSYRFKPISSCESPIAEPVDSDGGMLEVEFDTPAEVIIHSDKIEVPADGNCVFSFYYFANKGMSDILRPLINQLPVREIAIGNVENSGWVKYDIPLDEYAGTTIQIGFSFDSKESNMLIDDIRVAQQLNNNIKLNALLAPSSMKAGETTPVTVKVANIGTQDATGYTVDLLVNNEVYASKEGIALAKNAIEAIEFEVKPEVTWKENIEVKAIVNYADDMDTSDNESDTKTIYIVSPQYPFVSDLSAEEVSNGVALNWSIPNLDNNIICEDFESFVPFSIDGGNGWSTYDGDGLNTYGLQGIEYPNRFNPIAWLTMDISGPEYNSTWSAMSGSKIMASFSSEFGPVNDWLISPKLDGRAQTISLFARSYVADYGLEEFSVYYSSSSENPEDFKQLSDIIIPDTEWEEYSFDMPEGTTYFAIVCSSDDHFVLLVDDVTFCLPFDKENNQLVGFNIYRDSSLIGSVGADTSSYIDTDMKKGTHCYNVSAMYSTGESKLSNTADITTTSVKEVAKSKILVAGSKNSIIIDGENLGIVSIYEPSGKLVRTANVVNRTSIPVEKGIYIVKIADKAYKVVVR